MIVFVSGATATVRALHPHPHLAVLLTPRAMQSLDWLARSGVRWACDNDFFCHPDETAFCAMVDRVFRIPRCQFVTVPDVVADHDGTLEQWDMWYPYLAEVGLPAAFVLQDGATSTTVPWQQCRAVFLGGSTAYKLSGEARALCLEARRRGKWVHVGRVNSMRREHAISEFANSFDGGQYSRFPRRHLPRCLQRLEPQAVQRQMNLVATG